MRLLTSVERVASVGQKLTSVLFAISLGVSGDVQSPSTSEEQRIEKKRGLQEAVKQGKIDPILASVLNKIIDISVETKKQVDDLKRNQTTGDVTCKKPRIESMVTYPPNNNFIDMIKVRASVSGTNVNNVVQRNDSSNVEKKNNDSLNDNTNINRQLAHAIKVELINKEGSKRDYKFNSKTRFEHFMEFFRLELRTRGLLYIIDDSVDPPSNSDMTTVDDHKFRVLDILINKIDSMYHSRIIKIQDPKLILKTLKEIKRNENNITSVTIRKQLYSMQYSPNKETAMQFWDKFEKRIRCYDNIPNVAPFSETEKRDAFYNAIVNAVPDVKSIDFLTNIQTGSNLTYDALKSFIAQSEATKRQTTGTNSITKTTVPSASFAKSSNERCYGCGDIGHKQNECENKGKWKCYECQTFTNDHIAANCPQTKQKSGRGGYRGNRGGYRGNRSSYRGRRNYYNC